MWELTFGNTGDIYSHLSYLNLPYLWQFYEETGEGGSQSGDDDHFLCEFICDKQDEESVDF